MDTYDFLSHLERASGKHAPRAVMRAAAVLLALMFLFSPTQAMAAGYLLPENLKVIGDSAFQGTRNLGDVVIPSGVYLIGAEAFADCEGLTSLRVPKGAVILGNNALGRKGDTHKILGHPDSAAARYAKDYGLAFEEYYTDVEDLLKYAHGMLGEDYDDYDCVIFVYTCYKKALGIRIKNNCRDIQNNTNGIRIDSVDDLMPGDIICWKDDDHDYCTHVGMYVGAGTTYLGQSYMKGVFIESSSGYGEVRYNYIPSSGNSYYIRNFLCGWRILPQNQ